MPGSWKVRDAELIEGIASASEPPLAELWGSEPPENGL
jgi:hypothetical protein